MRTRKILRLYVGLLALAAMPQMGYRAAMAALPQPGDIVFGTNNASAALDIELLRGPAVLNGGVKQTSPWNQTVFLQTVRFDNLGGVAHNVNGNLLALDFGNQANGGLIYNLATKGTDPFPIGQLIGNTKAAPNAVGQGTGIVTLSRLSGLVVSPDNTKIAMNGYDTGTVIVYDYTAGDTFGAGASLTNVRQTGEQTLVGGSSQGVAWLDNDTVLAFTSAGKLFDINPADMSFTEITSVTTPFVGSNYSALAYNPAISRYLYASYSGFVTPTTTNRLYVFDPANNFSLVKEINLSTSSQTMREMALDKDGNLFIGGAGQTISFIPAANVLNPTTLTDNSSILWYDSTTSGNFNSLDIGFGTVSFEEADFNQDTFVNSTDFGIWKNGFGTSSGAVKADGDADGNGAVNGADFLIWQQQFGAGGAGAAAIPEPGSLVLLALGAVGFVARRRGGVA